MLFVHPDHRHGTYHHRDLMVWAKALSDRLGPLLIGVTSSNRVAPKLRLYQRSFGAPVAHLFAYGLHDRGQSAA
jgi:hypothetical protein